VCQNCDKRWQENSLALIHDIFQRCNPGEPFPSGECPDCGALCQEERPPLIEPPTDHDREKFESVLRIGDWWDARFYRLCQVSDRMHLEALRKVAPDHVALYEKWKRGEMEYQ
jgi:hypothetical protein